MTKKFVQESLRSEVFDNIGQLPADWDIPARNNLFLTQRYLVGLAASAPDNMQIHYIMVRRGTQPIAVGISQFLDMSRVRSFGERDNCLKNKVRTFVFRRFAANVLLLGNNMLTGQNAFSYTDGIDPKSISAALDDAMAMIRAKLIKKGKTPHLIIWKDFPSQMMEVFTAPAFEGYFRFSTQPNMVFNIPASWQNESDYVGALNKKYRDQYKRARKKSSGIQKRQLSLADVQHFRDRINDLYHNVAANAPFNTFYLHRDHFIELKRALKDDFLIYGYFEADKLVGFNTIIRNGSDIDTYFLGYDEGSQRNCMLYLNMLYDMIGYSIKNGFARIIFARTALEIKSSVGANPEPMYGLIKHENKLVNRYIGKLFGYFEPDVPWTKRHPFKDLVPRPSSVAEGSQCPAG